MAALANQIIENQRQAAITQQNLRSSRRVVTHRRTEPVDAEAEAEVDADTDVENERPANKKVHRLEPSTAPVTALAVVDTKEPKSRSVPVSSASAMVTTVAEIPETPTTLSSLDVPTDQFSAGLARRKHNRQLLMEWLRSALVENVDFGRIHIVRRDRCQLAGVGRVMECMDQSHWTKPCLFKAGAEKVTGMLGLTAHFPALPEYEKAVLTDIEISTVILRCELHDALGRVVAVGVGARNVEQDKGDISKTFRMVEKSAHIDATLRLTGLSEVFSQDVGDDTGQPPPKHPADRPPPASGSVSKPSRPTALTPKAADPKPKPERGAEKAATAKDIAALRQAIVRHGFSEQRVVEWLQKSTRGIHQLQDLTAPMCASMFQRLEQWADAEKLFPTTTTKTTD